MLTGSYAHIAVCARKMSYLGASWNARKVVPRFRKETQKRHARQGSPCSERSFHFHPPLHAFSDVQNLKTVREIKWYPPILMGRWCSNHNMNESCKPIDSVVQGLGGSLLVLGLSSGAQLNIDTKRLRADWLHNPDAPSMLYLHTFVLFHGSMWVNMPYMEHQGTKHAKHPQSTIHNHKIHRGWS